MGPRPRCGRRQRAAAALGIAIVGGLVVSQPTLFTTPVIYLYLDRLRWRARKRHAAAHA